MKRFTCLVWALVSLSYCAPQVHAEVLSWSKDLSAPDISRYYFMQLRVIEDEEYLVGFDTHNSNSGMAWRKTGGIWVDLMVPSGPWLDSITGTSAGNLWVSGNGRILHYDGTTWTPQLSFTGELAQIQAIDADNAFAVGTGGLRYQTANGGTDWVKLPNGPDNGVQFGLWLDETDIWVAGGGGMDGYTPFADHYDGVTWNTYWMDYGSKVTGIDKRGDWLYACGYSGKVWQYDGVSFNNLIGLPAGWAVVARTVVIDGDGNCWVAGDRGFIQRYDNATSEWELQMYLNNSTKDFKSLCIHDSDIYAVGEDGIWTAIGNWTVDVPCDSPFTADLDCNYRVDLVDFSIFTQEWQTNDPRLYPLYPE